MTAPRAPVAVEILDGRKPARHFARWMLQVSDAVETLTEPKALHWALWDMRTAAGAVGEVDAVVLQTATVSASLALTAAEPVPGVITLALEAPASVRLLRITAGLLGPATFTVCRSDDGILWHPTHRVLDASPWAVGETRAYTLTPAA